MLVGRMGAAWIFPRRRLDAGKMPGAAQSFGGTFPAFGSFGLTR
jgi:hypothetical protein